MACKVPFRLPRHPEDGQIICDRYGNKWRYSISLDTWTLQGLDFEVPLVSETNDGIISPEIYNKLTVLGTILQNYPYTLKINPATDAYWYLFRSSNKLIKFSKEDTSNLRIELDTGRLYQLLSKISCQGRRGEIGDNGPIGDRGNPATPEKYHKAKTNGTTLEVAVAVPTPIDTPISIRLYRVNAPYAVTPVALQGCNLEPSPIATLSTGNYRPYIDIDLLVGGTPVVVIDVLNQVDVNEINLSYNVETGTLCGTIGGIQPWGDKWLFKARQRGMVGDDGRDAPDFLEVEEVTVDDGLLKALQPLTSLRLSNDKRIIYTIRQTCDKVCVQKLKFAPNSGSIVPSSLFVLNSQTKLLDLVALQRSTDDCKDIVTYSHEFQFAEAPALELPSWTPVPGCLTKRHFNKMDYNWVGLTGQANNWDALDGMINSKYPWDILLQSEPEVDECCQEDLFYIKNPNDCEGLDGTGSGGGGGGTDAYTTGITLRIDNVVQEQKYTTSQPLAGAISNDAQWTIGAFKHYPTLITYMPADMDLAELIIFNRGLTNNEATTLYEWSKDPTKLLTMPSGAVMWLSGNYGLFMDLAGTIPSQSGLPVFHWKDRLTGSPLYAYNGLGYPATAPIVSPELVNGSRAVRFDQSGVVTGGYDTYYGASNASGYKMLETASPLMSLSPGSNFSIFALLKRRNPGSIMQQVVGKAGGNNEFIASLRSVSRDIDVGGGGLALTQGTAGMYMIRPYGYIAAGYGEISANSDNVLLTGRTYAMLVTANAWVTSG